MLIDECRQIANLEILPNLQKLEDDISCRHQLYAKMAERGLFSITIPRQYGGLACSSTAYVKAMEEISKADAGVAVTMGVTNMVAEAINNFGTPEIKEKYLPKFASGECVPAAFALTEKNAGSDVKSIITEAHFENNAYKLSGEKQFITNGDIAKLMIVMARTAPQKEGLISAFIVDPASKGFSVTKKENKIGLLTANLVDLSFDQLMVPQENLLGTLGEGLKVALKSLDSGRLGIAAQALGIAESAFKAAINYSKKRVQFGHPISEFQAIAFKLADMHVKIEASRQLIMHAALFKDAERPYILQAATAKLFSSEACLKVVDEALQIHGAYGYIKDYMIEKYWRDARATTLYEGTSEIQHLVISREILQDK